MSEREPITAAIRKSLDASWDPWPAARAGLLAKCDAIDAVHAGLERENAELRERVAELDNRSESMHIGSATVTITPTLDWSGVARELRSIAATLAGDA